MPQRVILLASALAAACGGSATHGASLLALRPACGSGTLWTGTACQPIGDGPAAIATAAKALGEAQLDDAVAALTTAEHAGPLDHQDYVALWEQRAIAASYLEDIAGALAAFDMVLALDPGHFMNYNVSPKATLRFQDARDLAQKRGAPEVEVEWSRGLAVGSPIPLDVEVVADPKQFLDHAAIFVRTRDDQTWRAADLPLRAPGGYEHVLLPAIAARKPTSLELYLRAYDAHGNEVLTWADPTRPREIALRYDAPTPWYRKWWVITIASSAVAVGTGVTVYALTVGLPSKFTLGATVR